MAYVSNTQELCQRICEGDVNFVDAWCEENPNAVDRRDHTGRTPLQLAVSVSTPEVVQCLVDHGARIVSRLVDGMTALHIAAVRGNTEIVTILLKRSESNEAEEAEKEDRRKAEKKAKAPSAKEESDEDDSAEEHSDEGSDEDIEGGSSEE
ncbi:MAG: hypothetical protein Q9168_004222 [Polycauliona sp. 1 TL-2023]